MTAHAASPAARLAALGLCLCLACVGARAAEPGDFIARYAAEHDFSGTVLVRADGAIRHEASFGRANIAFDVANTPRTKYPVASITKLFTATLVMQLRERGRLDLDGVIADYLSDYAGEGARTVTVRQLLNHTSGIANFDRVGDMATALRDGLPNYQTPYTSDQLLARFCSGGLVHPPGTAFDYNNGDYVILGKIVERLHGKPFDAVLAEHILRPLGLSDTGMRAQHRIVAGLADTYFHRDDLGTLVPDLPVYPENWYAAGAMYSTAQDLLAFSDALFGGRLVNADSLASMLAPGLDDYGFGLWVYDLTVDGVPHRVAKRPGRIMGAQAQLFRFLDSGTTIVLLANAGRADLDEFVAEIARRTVRADFNPRTADGIQRRDAASRDVGSASARRMRASHAIGRRSPLGRRSGGHPGAMSSAASQGEHVGAAMAPVGTKRAQPTDAGSHRSILQLAQRRRRGASAKRFKPSAFRRHPTP